MDNKNSLTALISCYARGFHTTYSKNPIFYDKMAFSFISEDEKRMIEENWTNAIQFFNSHKETELYTSNDKLEWVMNTQCVPQVVSRARYEEEALEAAIERGLKQYILLGAGFDTFSYRQKNIPKDFMIYEVDHPSTQAAKINRLNYARLTIPSNVKYISVDFNKDDLYVELQKNGYDKHKYSFFSCLGVSMYLNKQKLLTLLKHISEITPNGSSFILDYLDNTALDDNLASEKLVKMKHLATQTGEPIITSFDPLLLDLELQNTEMLVYENLSPDQIEERYFQNRQDELHAYSHFHFAHLAVHK
ncbi:MULTISPECIES: class I SAM-dependent methyltransferase [Bacillus]|uniref:class I SAM-dependent methyltransferase n=1 Tax=Bacillus TaxID=1386 RepID=UPI0011DD4C94|nr:MULTISPECIES: SAM-dependent methyltransferase [Bacillus]